MTEFRKSFSFFISVSLWLILVSLGALRRLQEIAVDPALVLRGRVRLRPTVLKNLHLIPLAARLKDAHARAVLSHPDYVVRRARPLAQVYISHRQALTPDGGGAVSRRVG